MVLDGIQDACMDGYYKRPLCNRHADLLAINLFFLILSNYLCIPKEKFSFCGKKKAFHGTAPWFSCHLIVLFPHFSALEFPKAEP